jgi:ribosomal protein S18 acetylase RimI-like enzyme
VAGEFSIGAFGPGDDRKAFSCGSPALDRYLQELATQDVRRRVSNCFVARDGSGRIAGYYTLAATSLPLADVTPDQRRRMPRYPLLPAALIGRLAVDQAFQGCGLGGALLIDAARRAGTADPAVFAVVVHAKDDRAVLFYRNFGFTNFSTRPMSLYSPLATALKAVRASSS